MKSPAVFYGVLILGVVLLGIGAYGIWEKNVTLHTTSLWAFMIPVYTFFALTAITELPVSLFALRLVRAEVVEVVSRYLIALSIITVLPAFVVIFADLTQLWAFPWMFLSFNAMSRIAWMAVFYIIFVLALLMKLVQEIRGGSHRNAFWIALAVLIFSALAHLNLGMIFGSSYGVPAWYGLFTGVYLVTIGIVASFALMPLALAISEKIRHGHVREEVKEFTFAIVSKALLILIPLFVFLTAWYIETSRYSPPVYQAVYHMVYGALSNYFWGIVVVLGVLISIVLIIVSHLRKNFGLLSIAALFVLAGQFTALTLYILAGQIGAMQNQLSVYGIENYDFASDIYEFFSPIELSALPLAVGLWLVLWALAVRLLALEKEDKAVFIFRKIDKKQKLKK
ncbi:MAG: NrfD/PsrC family molybdoenzyme membrane anchor subunit, partial [Pyrobaculum sp.]